MIVNSFGINTDQGIPFSTKDEFEKFFVPAHPVLSDKLQEWFQNGVKPILVSGQIGSGKTTLINKAVIENQDLGIIQFHLDYEVTDKSTGGFLWYILKKIASYAMEKSFPLSSYIFLNDLEEITDFSWEKLIEIDNLKFQTLSYNNQFEYFINLFQEKEFYIVKNIQIILNDLNLHQKNKLILIFFGIDKYDILSSEYYNLKRLIEAFQNFKLLIELNAAHFFDNRWNTWEKLFIGSFSDEFIQRILLKRLGVYSNWLEPKIHDFTKYSGGNPRQALHLLDNFIRLYKTKSSHSEIIKNAALQTLNDYFAFAETPDPGLIRYIQKHKKIRASSLNPINDMIGTIPALFENWIFLTGKQIGIYWEVLMNPLVDHFYKLSVIPVIESHTEIRQDIESEEDFPNESELHFKSGNEFSELPKPRPFKKLNFNRIWGHFLKSIISERPEDKTIIIFNDPILKDITVNAIKSKFELNFDFVIKFKQFKKSHYRQLSAVIASNNPRQKLFLFEYLNEISENDLVKIDKFRDALIPFKMVWWIEAKYITKYLQRWTHLRQLFSIIELETNIRNLINIEEIERDLELLTKVRSTKNSVKKSLELLKEKLQES